MFCTKVSERCVTFTTHGVSCGTKKLKRCWSTEFETTTNWNAEANQDSAFAGSSGTASELAGLRATVPQRADAEILMGAQPQ